MAERVTEESEMIWKRTGGGRVSGGKDTFKTTENSLKFCRIRRSCVSEAECYGGVAYRESETNSVLRLGTVCEAEDRIGE